MGLCKLIKMNAIDEIVAMDFDDFNRAYSTKQPDDDVTIESWNVYRNLGLDRLIRGTGGVFFGSVGDFAEIFPFIQTAQPDLAILTCIAPWDYELIRTYRKIFERSKTKEEFIDNISAGYISTDLYDEFRYAAENLVTVGEIADACSKILESDPLHFDLKDYCERMEYYATNLDLNDEQFTIYLFMVTTSLQTVLPADILAERIGITGFLSDDESYQYMRNFLIGGKLKAFHANTVMDGMHVLPKIIGNNRVENLYMPFDLSRAISVWNSELIQDQIEIFEKLNLPESSQLIYGVPRSLSPVSSYLATLKSLLVEANNELN